MSAILRGDKTVSSGFYRCTSLLFGFQTAQLTDLWIRLHPGEAINHVLGAAPSC